jgi:hypothetical protein
LSTSPDIEAFADALAEEIRGGGPRPEPIPIPPRWEALIREVQIAAARHAWDPSQPLYRIGRFDVVLLRGEGGYGLVFEVIDPELRRNVALKLCRVRDDAAADDILAEARVLAKLRHPNVITVHETGRWGDDVFFVMDYAEGKTAHDFGKSDPPWQKVLDIYMDAGKGLAAAHDAGIVHGDFKPANLLLDPGGAWPRVADFGLARIRLEHTPEGEREEVRRRGGTLAFAAPEVLRGQATDALSDQWSFCVALWQTLERVLPFWAESSERLLEVIENSEPLAISGKVPERLRDVLRVGLSIDPRERFPDMHALLRALDAVRRAESEPKRKGPGWAVFVVGMLVSGGSVFLLTGPWREPVGDETSGSPSAMATTPVSACAVEGPEQVVRPPVEEVCELIRAGQLKLASRTWHREHGRRVVEGDEVGLDEDTVIVARTFVEQAEHLLRLGVRAEALVAANEARDWALQVGGSMSEGIVDRANAIANTR